MTGDASIVPFPHPGGEHVPRTDVMPWNTGPHRRKFLRNHGSIVSPDGTVTFGGQLVFWGEWKPSSIIERRWTSKRGFPALLHAPCWDDPEPLGNRQDTDPRAFGSNFLYSNCKQLNPTGTASALQHLQSPAGGVRLRTEPVNRIDTSLNSVVSGVLQAQRTELHDDAPTGSGNSWPSHYTTNTPHYMPLAGRPIMSSRDYRHLAALSPFELKDRLLTIASSDDQRLLLNAGRGNPNFLATLPRWAFLALGQFAMAEAERTHSYLDSGFAGLPEQDGIVQRFETYATLNNNTDGILFLRAALSYVKSQLGIDGDTLLFEMVGAFLGCNYPAPPRMLPQTERIVKAYIAQELFGDLPSGGSFSLFATEGGTAAMTYIFQSLRANRLIKSGDTIALATPIFSPYLEIPVLGDYDLEILDISMDEHDDWQLADAEIAKLRNPAIKLMCLVNPSNPPSTKLADAALNELAAMVNCHRPDLLIVTDDVYATFADEFVSIFAKCPRNTICVYSFSKYFGATGWRLGAIALHDENVFDAQLKVLPQCEQDLLATRYASLTNQPQALKFIDRLVADSRAVALKHTAGLSAPQQLQMALFALHGLMDCQRRYKNAAKELIRHRYQTLYTNMGMKTVRGPNDVDYYAFIDLEEIGGTLYGAEFAAWFDKRKLVTGYLFRLAEETGVVLLPGSGFGGLDSSVRVSLANLTDMQYASIGRFTRRVLDEYFQEFKSGSPG